MPELSTPAVHPVVMSTLLLLLSSCNGVPRLPSDDLLHHPRRAGRRFAEPIITSEEQKSEVAEKVRRVRELLARTGKAGLLLTRETTFSWITAGGENFIVHATADAFAKVLITGAKVVLICNNIEAPRLEREVVSGLGFDVEVFKYFEKEEEERRIARYCPDPASVLTDAANPGGHAALASTDLMGLLFPLTESELERYRWLGHKCSEVIETVAEIVRPGMTELDLQYLLAREFWYWDIFPTVNLASVDHRVRTFKHPFPNGATLQKYVNLNVCVRRWGMIISMSRLMHFGEPDEELKRVYKVGAQVMAAMLNATKVGNRFQDVLDANVKAYADGGYPDEWQRHLQGGPILTAERIVLLRHEPEIRFTNGMALAYNPTCNGSKHEDTFLVTDQGIEMLTPCIRWPTKTVRIDGKEYRVPDLKVIR